jgi:hypothetical protein
MVWIKSQENTYVNVDNILSITFDENINSFVAVIGYKDVRLQHNIYHNKALDSLLQGTTPPSESEIIERIITEIEAAKRNQSPGILDFNKLLNQG